MSVIIGQISSPAMHEEEPHLQQEGVVVEVVRRALLGAADSRHRPVTSQTPPRLPTTRRRRALGGWRAVFGIASDRGARGRAPIRRRPDGEGEEMQPGKEDAGGHGAVYGNSNRGTNRETGRRFFLDCNTSTAYPVPITPFCRSILAPHSGEQYATRGTKYVALATAVAAPPPSSSDIRASLAGRGKLPHVVGKRLCIEAQPCGMVCALHTARFDDRGVLI